MKFQQLFFYLVALCLLVGSAEAQSKSKSVKEDKDEPLRKTKSPTQPLLPKQTKSPSEGGFLMKKLKSPLVPDKLKKSKVSVPKMPKKEKKEKLKMKSRAPKQTKAPVSTPTPKRQLRTSHSE